LQIVGAGLLTGATKHAALGSLGDEGRLPLWLPQDFGAAGDGIRLDSPAINAAIERAASLGGGVVYLRPGTYLSGTVILKSKVTLYLEAGAMLLGATDVSKYTPQPGPGEDDDANQRHLVYARDVEDVTIAGAGVIDGQGKTFWVPTHRQQMPHEEHWQDVVTRDWQPKARVSPMVELVGCRRLHIEGVRIENSSGWTMRIINCNNVVVDSVSISNPVYGINVDGIDISNSSDVRISNSSIETADDAICLKSENPYGDIIPRCRNIAITNCTMTGCCNGFKVGTRTEGAFENIVFSNSVIYNDDVDLNSRIISGICLEIVDGGSAEGVVISGIRMQRTRTPIFLRLGDRSRHHSKQIGTLSSISITDVLATDAVLTSSIAGIPGHDVEDVTISNVQVTTLDETKAEWLDKPVPEEVGAYPEARMFGRLPAYGLYARHVRGLRLLDLSFASKAIQQTPAVACDDVKDVEISALRANAPSKGSSVVSFVDVQDAWVRNVRIQEPIRSFLIASGSRSSNILISHCDMRKANQLALLATSFPSHELVIEANVAAKDTGPAVLPGP